jgi:hypothetical protein
LNEEVEEEMEELTTSQYVTYSIVCLCLTLTAGFMSGMTVGLASIDSLDVELKK